MTEGPQLCIPEYETVNFASGPLVFFDRVAGAHYNEGVEVITPDGERRRGPGASDDHDRRYGHAGQDAGRVGDPDRRGTPGLSRGVLGHKWTAHQSGGPRLPR